jgi:glycosyltransferase involved in cell wall biosynthesis
MDETLKRPRVRMGEQVHTGGPPPLTRHGISIVLPAWNEESLIADTVAKVVNTLSVMAPNFEVIVVNDGSRDRTGEILDALAARDRRIRVVHHEVNRGYGAAVLSGFDAAAKELTFFMDSDGQFDINDIALLIEPWERREADVILGYRKHRQDPPMRKMNAWAWKRLVSMLFHLRVRDIDCAFKLMPTKMVQIADVHAQGAMVNTELLAKFVRMRVTIKQVPVGHYPRTAGKATGANLGVILHAFRELFKLAGKLRSWYPPPDFHYVRQNV